MNQIGTNVAIKKAQIIYQESEQKIALAKAKSQECPRRLNNVDAVVANLHEVASFCEEASSKLKEQKHLHVIGTGGKMMNDIQAVDMSFH